MKIKELRDKGIVIIDNHRIRGFLDVDGRKCDCGTILVYYDKYDTYFCPKCNKWTESKCNDPSCDYCKNRPKMPLK